MSIASILASFLGSSGSSGSSSGSGGLTKNLFNPAIKSAGNRAVANLLDPGGLLNIFGKQNQKKKFTGRTPFGSLREIPETQKVLGTLDERLAGRNVGFRPEVISGATAPFAAQRRAGLAERTIPSITSSASARGLNRSSIVPGQVGQATAGAERDISSRVAELSLANEQQRRAEINDALAKLQAFTVQEAATKAGAANFDMSGFATTAGLNQQDRQLGQQDFAQTLQLLKLFQPTQSKSPIVSQTFGTGKPQAVVDTGGLSQEDLKAIREAAGAAVKK